MHDNAQELSLSAAFLILCVVIFFHPFFLSGKVLSANDVAYQYLPFSLDAPSGFTQPYNYLLADQSQQFYSLRTFWKNSVLKGCWPRWLPHILCGQWFTGEILAQAYYPPNLLSLFMPIPVAESLINLIEISFAGLGVLLFLGCFDIRPTRGLVGALAYMFCSYNIVWLNHVHSSVSVYLPLLLWSFEIIFSGSVSPRRGVAACAIITFLVLTGGHPNSAILVFFLAALYVLFRLLVRPREGRTGRARWVQVVQVGLGLGLGVGLASAVMIPFIDARLSGDFYYGNRPGVALLSPPLRALGFLPLVLPKALGSPVTWNDHNVYNFNENAMFVGVATLIVAFAAFPWAIRRPLYAFFLLVAVCSLLTLRGIDPVSYLVRRIPVLRDNHIQRITLLTQFSMAMCGAIGWDTLFRRNSASSSLSRMWPLLTVCMAAISLPVVFVMAKHPVGYGFYVMACAGAGIALLLLTFLSEHRRLAAWILIPVLFLELYATEADFNPFLPRDQAVLKEPAVSREMKERAGGHWFRMTAVDGTFMPNLASLFGLNDIRGYDIPIFGRYVDFLKDLFYGGRWPFEVNYWYGGPPIQDAANQRWMNLLGVRFVLWGDNGRLMQRENPDAFPHGFWATDCVPSSGSLETDVELVRTGICMVAETEFEASYRNGRGSIRELPADCNHARFEVIAETPGIFVLNETPIDGWRVRIDGVPRAVFPVNVVQQGVRLEAGKHVVEFVFLPPSFVDGVVVSGCSTVLLALLLAPFRFGKRKENRPIQ
jgi:hypothetical protein